MRGVQKYHTHAAQRPVGHLIDHLVGHGKMIPMPPPEHYVSAADNFVGEPFGALIVQTDKRHFVPRFFEKVTDTYAHALFHPASLCLFPSSESMEALCSQTTVIFMPISPLYAK